MTLAIIGAILVCLVGVSYALVVDGEGEGGGLVEDKRGNREWDEGESQGGGWEDGDDDGGVVWRGRR